MKTVFFMGAGFSAPFGLPTMNEFLNEIARTDRISQEDKEFIYGLVLDARRANSILESSPTNLEDLLSFAVMGDRIVILGDKEEPKGPRIKYILHRIYSALESTKFDTYWDDFKQFSIFLGQDLTKIKSNISFVTTNYDLIIECTLFESGLNALLPFQYKTTYDKHGRLFYDKTDGIPLFKLHGSLNWFENDKGEIAIDDRLIEVTMNPEKKNLLPAQYIDNYKSPGDILLIPPTFLKPDLPPELMKNWSGAAQEIQRAEILVFVGYSFPSSDIEMKYFLARSLENNAVLRKIIIVNPDANQICNRLKKPKSGYGSHFKDFLEPLPGRWGELKLSIDSL